MSERFTAQELAMLSNPAYIGSHQPWVGELDLVNVVRCRDCKNHIDTPKRGCRCYRWMTLDCYENPVPSEVKPDGFCAWGERK